MPSQACLPYNRVLPCTCHMLERFSDFVLGSSISPTSTGTATLTLLSGGQCMKVTFSTSSVTEFMCTTRGYTADTSRSM